MKKWYMTASTLAAFLMTYTASAHAKEEEVAEQVVVAPENVNYGGLHEHVAELEEAAKNTLKEAATEKAELETKLLEVNDKVNKATCQSAFFKNADANILLLKDYKEFVEGIKEDLGPINTLNEIFNAKEEAPEGPDAKELKAKVLALLGKLTNAEFSAYNPTGKGMITYKPFRADAVSLKVGQNVFVPGTGIYKSKKRALDISTIYDPNSARSYWSMRNGTDTGPDRICEQVEVEDVAGTHVITWSDGSSLILLPKPENYNEQKAGSARFLNRFTENQETGQVDCNNASEDFVMVYPVGVIKPMAYSMGNVKPEETKTRTPSGIMSSLNALRDVAPLVENPSMLAPLGHTIVLALDETLKNIDTQATILETFVGGHESL